MLTIEYILERFKSKAIDGRDVSRLIYFLPISDWEKVGIPPDDAAEGAEWVPVEFTEENVLLQLQGDLRFAFEKALGQRGLSASLMRDVIKMWLWILESPLPEEHEDHYAQYGLPLLKAVAVKFGFENEIGEDRGDEDKYGAYYDE